MRQLQWLWRRVVFFAFVVRDSCGAVLPPLPTALRLEGLATVSGISSGADLAVILHVAYSDRIFGSGIFAGQAFGCATTYFESEPLARCASQPPTQQGPGCVGLASTGAAPCLGCPNSSVTVQYDHCKKSPQIVDVARLQQWARAEAAGGAIAPLHNLRDAFVYTYHGTKDKTYEPPSVNATGAFFATFMGNAAEQLHVEASIPSDHCQPTVDPHVPRDSCGKGWQGGLENCGYDGVGVMFQHFYRGSLTPPPFGATTDPSRLFNFSQDLYGNASAEFGGLASGGFVYVPKQCEHAPCRLHVALHGCGQAAVFPDVGLLYVSFGGYAPWADSNGIVVLFPQGGGFRERGWTTPAAQVMGGCHDGYGQTGPGYASRQGVVPAAIMRMVDALHGHDPLAAISV